MKKIIKDHQKNFLIVAVLVFVVSTFLFYKGTKDRMIQNEEEKVEIVMTDQVRKFNQKQRLSSSTDWLFKDDFLFVDSYSSWAVYDEDNKLLYPNEVKEWTPELEKAVVNELENAEETEEEVHTTTFEDQIVGVKELNLSKNDEAKYLVFTNDLTEELRTVYIQTLSFSLNVAFILILLIVVTIITFHLIQQKEDEQEQEFKRVKKQLDRRNNEYKQYVRQTTELLYHLVIGVMTINSHKEITMVNPSINEMIQENLYDYIGKDYNEAISSKEMKRYIEKAFKQKTPINADLTIFNERERILDLNIIPIKNNISKKEDLIVLLYDTTEIHRLEKIRTDFVANASHELRTPITAIKGFSETLLDGAMYDPDALKEFLDIIYKESIRLDYIVNDILQISKLEQKAVPMNLEKVNVTDVVEEVSQILKQKMEIKNMNFHFDADKELILETSEDQLKQILINLVHNAISYTPDKGEISIELEETETQGIIRVIDNGIGMEPSEIDRIFERFYRIDKGRSRNVGGTGLGLSIVRWLVDNLHGQIEVESELDKGSTFTVILPKKFESEE